MLASILGADETSVGYQVGYVLGIVVPIVLVLGLAVFGIRALARRQRPPAQPPAAGETGPAPAPVGATPPGWHPDPSGTGLLRWWDGTTWTGQTTGQVTAHPTPPMAPGPPRAPRPPGPFS